jgi:hypothetical protein
MHMGQAVGHPAAAHGVPAVAAVAAPPPVAVLPEQYADILDGINDVIAQCAAVNNASYKRKIEDVVRVRARRHRVCVCVCVSARALRPRVFKGEYAHT